MTRWLSAAVFGLFLLTASSASADITKGECVDANGAGQSLRREGKLSAAKAQFQKCNDPACPELVRTDCFTRLDEIENAFPSVIFDVKDPEGVDRADVTVKVDGVVADKAGNGTPMRVEPGTHEVTFESPGEKPLVRTFIFKEGERGRREKITIGEPKVVAPPPPTTGPVGPVEPVEPGRARKNFALIGGAVGIVALGVGTVFGLKAAGKSSDQKKECATTESCTPANRTKAQSDHDSAVSAGRLSTIFTIAGGAIVVGALVVYLTAPSGQRTAAMLHQLAAGPNVAF